MLTPNYLRHRRYALQGNVLGFLGASLVLATLLTTWAKVGQPLPPSMSQARFSVAVLAGTKQAAQVAPENTMTVVESVITAPEKKTDVVAAAQRETSLPDAVAAAQDARPTNEPIKPVEVIPPAQVSMPGGRLSSEDAPVGQATDPFAIGPRQVYIRLYVDKDGRVVRDGIVRSGEEPMRDALILKALRSRIYTAKGQIRVPGGQELWQLDMVIDYGTNEFIP